MLKSYFNTEYISVKIGIIFTRLGISPNTWTLLALIPAVLGFATLSLCPQNPQNLIIGLGFFVLAGFIDAIDGAVARVTGSETAKGAYLDGIIDRYVEILLYLGLLIYGISSFWICMLIFGAIMTSFTRAYADHRKIITDEGDLKRMGGILERFERLMLIFSGMLLTGYFAEPVYLTYAVILAAILANITALQRIFFVVRYENN